MAPRFSHRSLAGVLAGFPEGKAFLKRRAKQSFNIATLLTQPVHPVASIQKHLPFSILFFIFNQFKADFLASLHLRLPVWINSPQAGRVNGNILE